MSPRISVFAALAASFLLSGCFLSEQPNFRPRPRSRRSATAGVSTASSARTATATSGRRSDHHREAPPRRRLRFRQREGRGAADLVLPDRRRIASSGRRAAKRRSPASPMWCFGSPATRRSSTSRTATSRTKRRLEALGVAIAAIRMRHRPRGRSRRVVRVAHARRADLEAGARIVQSITSI